jgi:ABC-type spermidine/putrescine transport system permease subunit II
MSSFSKRSKDELTIVGELTPLGVVLLLAFFVPLSLLLAYSFWKQSGFDVVHEFTLASYITALTDTFYLKLLLRSLVIGAAVAFLSVALAYPYAYAATFRFPRARGALLFAALLSMFTSYLVRVYAFQTILGETGVINSALQGLHVIDKPLSFLLFNSFAVVITLTNVFLPYVLLPIWAAMQSVERNQLEAARDLGARPFATFWRVVYPMTKNGARAGFLFAFVLAAGDYVTPTLVGGPSGTMIGREISVAFGLLNDYPLGAALAFVLLIAFAVAAWILPALIARIPRPPAVRSVLSAPLRASDHVRLPLSRYWAHAYVAAVVLFLFVPLAIIILLSFNTSSVPAFPMRGLTLHWYSRVFSDITFRDALFTSLKVAALTASIAAVLGTLAALAFARHKFRGRGPLMALLFAPLAMPGLITGIAMLTVYVALSVSLSLWTVTIGHLVYATPFVVLAIVAGLSDLDPALEEAGRDLGRGPFGVFRKVTLPLVFPVIVGAAFVAAALSLDEFIITNFVAGSTVTLPLYIWSKLRIGVTPDTNAVGTLILVGLTLLSLAAWYLTRLTSTFISRRGESK